MNFQLLCFTAIFLTLFLDLLAFSYRELDFSHHIETPLRVFHFLGCNLFFGLLASHYCQCYLFCQTNWIIQHLVLFARKSTKTSIDFLEPSHIFFIPNSNKFSFDQGGGLPSHPPLPLLYAQTSEGSFLIKTTVGMEGVAISLLLMFLF